MCSIFTLSSHAPYDQPMKDVLTKGRAENKYLNAAYYADRSIGEFMDKAGTRPWFKNTLFVFVADHAHPTHLHSDMFIAQHHHIPLLLYGEVIKPGYRGYFHEKMVQQHDLAATLLSRLHLPHKEFFWSRDVLNPYTQQWAYMSYSPDGFIWVHDGEEYSIDHFRNNEFHHNFISDSTKTPQLLKEGKSYMQEVFRQYLEM